MGSEQVLTLVVTLAGRVVVDSTGVEDEGIWTSINRDCHGPLGVQGLLQSILTAISLHKVALQQRNSLTSDLCSLQQESAQRSCSTQQTTSDAQNHADSAYQESEQTACDARKSCQWCIPRT